MELVLTVPYVNVYEQHQLDPSSFKVIVPVGSIRMASLFDHSVYPAFHVEASRPAEHSAEDDAVREEPWDPK
jgi:hypothetical protein